MAFKQKKYNKLLGIDISENNLVVTELQLIKDRFKLLNFFSLNFPIFQDIDKTIYQLKENIKARNIKTKECAIGFSMQYFKILPVSIPSSIPEDEVLSIVLQEGNFDQENDIVSWIPLNSTKREETDGITRFDVLGISTKKNTEHLASLIANKSTLKMISLTPSFLNLGYFLQEKSNNALTITLWVSQIRSELVAWSNQEPIYEHLFLTHQFNDQLFQAINHLQSQLGGINISRIFVFGPYSKEINYSMLPYSVEQFSFPQNIIDLTKIPQSVSTSELINSIALAAISSNNLQHKTPNLLLTKNKPEPLKGIFKEGIIGKQKPKKEFKMPFSQIKILSDPQLSKFILSSILVLALSICSTIAIQNLLLPSISNEGNITNNKLNITQLHLNKLLTYEKTNKVLKTKTEYFSELITKRKPFSKIIKEVANMTPKELWIDRLEIRSNNVDIFGRALNVDAVANFSINLNYTAMLLGNAQIISLRRFQEEGIDIIEFQLKSKILSKSKSNLTQNKNKPPEKTQNNVIN